jgi:hypothetical protein
VELLFVVLGGAILGLAARYALPRRHTYGSALAPAIAAIVWVALTWFGWAWDGAWIWVATLVLAGLASAASVWLIGPRRERQDAEVFERLARPGAGTRAA